MTAAQALATRQATPPATSLEVLDGQIVVLPLDGIDLDDVNDRIDWESKDAIADLHDLAFKKIAVHGFLTRYAPMLIVQENGRYIVKDGNRRTAAMKLLY